MPEPGKTDEGEDKKDVPEVDNNKKTASEMRAKLREKLDENNYMSTFALLDAYDHSD